MYAYLSSFFSPSQVDNASYWSQLVVTITALLFLTIIAFGYVR